MMFGVVVAMTSALAMAAVAQDSGMTKAALRSQLDAALSSGAYRSAEIKFGPGQVKVVTITADGQKVETIYGEDANGNLLLLKSETEAADGDDLGQAGLEVKSVSRDFLDEDDNDNDSDDDDDSDDDNDDDGDEGDDDNSGHGGDDDGGDDDNSGHGGGDDDSDDDNDDDSGSDSDDDSDDDNDDD